MDQSQDEPGPNTHFTDDDVLSVTQLNGLTRRPKEQNEVASQFGSLVNVELLWRQLLFTVHHSTVSDKHLTATCNAICYVVRALANTTDIELRDFVCSDAVWMQCFEAARSAFAASKTKPALQVLETLAYLAKHNTVGPSMSIGLPAAALQMVRIISTQRPQKSLKDACIILYFFLRKLSDSFSFSEVLDTVLTETRTSFLYFCRVSDISYDFADGNLESNWVSFILSLLMIMPIADSQTAVLKLLSLICTNPVQHDIETVNLVQKAIEIYGVSNEKALEAITKDVLPSIISTKEQFYTFLPKSTADNVGTPTKVNLMLSYIKLGLSKAYITQAELPSLLNNKLSTMGTDSRDGDSSYEMLTLLLSSVDADIRQNACDLLLSSVSLKTTDIAEALSCLIDSLPALHDDNDAYHRGEMYSIFRRFILRVSQRLTALASYSAADREELFTLLDGFLRKYIEFLVTELEPSLSYSRHILALDLLCFIAKTSELEKGLAFTSALSDANSEKALFRLALDPYNDIREAAVTALSYLSRINQKVFHACIREIHPLETSFRLAAATNRADHADALGRLISLLSNTSAETAYALVAGDYISLVSTSATSKSLEAHVQSLHGYQVSSQYPLHGILLGIAYSLAIPESLSAPAEVQGLQESLLLTCQHIWDLSKVHLCIDSPEVELDIELEENMDFGPKDVLAYAWRALRDSNMLLQAMLTNLSITLELLASVGAMCFEQLCLLRHRGAFSTVAQTFLLCCQKARNHLPENGGRLINGWFDKALLELESQADKLTRRSAGLPALFTALLDPQNQSVFLTQFNILAKIAERRVSQENMSLPQDEMRLPQVHALNCIKDIVTNSRFRNMTEPLVMRTINLAAECMGSQIWAIKNCGLMLLRASINRLDPDTSLGASEAGLDTRSHASVGKTPLDVAIFLLSETNRSPVLVSEIQNAAQTEAEFAGLDLLGRLYVHNSDTNRVREIVTLKLAHPLWHIRAQAARLLFTMTQAGGECQLLERIELQLEQALSTNEVHGNLLVLREVLSSETQNLYPGDLIQRLSSLIVSARSQVEFTNDQIVTATWLNLVNRLRETSDSAELREALNQMMGASKPQSPPSSGPSAALEEEVTIHLLRSCRSDEDDDTARALAALKHDENITINVIKRLEKEQMTLDTLAVLTQVVMSHPAELVRAHAMSAIYGYRQRKPASIGLDVTALSQTLDFTRPISRALFLSQLKLFSYLCEYAWEHGHTSLRDKIRGLSSGFCLHLRHAAHDDYEETTRRVAVETIVDLTCSSHGFSIFVNLFSSHNQLEILSVLYDLLNDDDEDIRQLATNATARFCNPCHSQTDIIHIGNAFASRQRLCEYMLGNFASDTSLRHECLRRILDWKSDIPVADLGSYICRLTKISSVQQALDAIMAASNDLFAEEKQNLYIDEHAEVKAWAETMCAVDARLDDDLIVCLYQWAEQGIGALVQYLDTLEKSKTISYDLALELLIVRTITIARLMGTNDRELESLKAKCERANLSVSVLSSFDWLLQRPSQDS